MMYLHIRFLVYYCCKSFRKPVKDVTRHLTELLDNRADFAYLSTIVSFPGF
jgi:hypothetical protein